MTILKVIENDLCTGCGACTLGSGNLFKVEMQESGFYKAKLNDKAESSELQSELQKASKVCPFSSDSMNEDELAKKRFHNKNYNEKLGYYNNIYAGKIKDDSKRLNSSSGGLTTWFAEKLLIENEIDSVVHVAAGDNGAFVYSVSHSIEELHLIKKKKSRYSPVTFDNLKDYLLETQDRVYFVGIPCFVKSIRLLQEQLGLDCIKYAVSLLCGHMKSIDFGNSLAWEVGVSPPAIRSLDFRVKRKGLTANNYLFSATDNTNRTFSKLNSSLFSANWGWGFFKHKACDYCDDVAGELADVTFGDAWLDKYVNDSLGTNVVVSRSDIFDKLLIKYADELEIEPISIEDFVSTQGGNYRHRVGGIKVRVDNATSWVPKKRLYLSEKYTVTEQRKKLYLYREYVSRKSISAFQTAKKYNSFLLFKIIMMPIVLKLDFIDGGLIRVIKNQVKVQLPNYISDFLFRKRRVK
jgi:coenzyme F420-reducing hydrogenase beta subunit